MKHDLIMEFSEVERTKLMSFDETLHWFCHNIEAEVAKRTVHVVQ